MSRSFLRMLSGAAGLLFAFTALSLPFLFSTSGEPRMKEAAIRILLGIAACFLLWFFLSHTEAERLLKFHSRPQR
jgi:cytochrome c biogenesis protein CcdA